MPPELVFQAASVVIRGDFNPVIFHPSWLAKNNLIKPQEADAADIKIVCPDVAVFEVGWLQVQVLRDRLTVRTAQEPYYEYLRDLVVGILVLLPHTPLRQVGLNREFDYRMASEEAWHTVGHTLAPKQPWDGILVEPGMRSLTMRQERPDQYKGYILVKVEPSMREPYGVDVSINDHYETQPPPEAASAADQVLQVVQEQWRDSMQRSLTIAEGVASIGGQE